MKIETSMTHNQNVTFLINKCPSTRNYRMVYHTYWFFVVQVKLSVQNRDMSYRKKRHKPRKGRHFVIEVLILRKVVLRKGNAATRKNAS